MPRPYAVAHARLREISVSVVRTEGKVTKVYLNRTVLEQRAIEGDSPVGEKVNSFLGISQVAPATGKRVRIRADHGLRLNTL